MVKIIEIKYAPNMVLHEHYCPACECNHQIAVVQPFNNGEQWSFNNDYDKPTFNPSIRTDGGVMVNIRCHYFIKDGNIEYCGDCFHQYKGKTIELPDIPEELL